MANQKKKKSRRMKRQVRKTLGALFLASALAVAAIPTESYEGGDVQAAVSADGSSYSHVVNERYYDGTDNTLHSETYPITPVKTAKSVYVNTADTEVTSGNIGVDSVIPICQEDSTVYSTGDGYFQFAYVDETGNQNGSGEKFAVILGYSQRGSLSGGTLTIPDTLDAYLIYNENEGTATGYVAVGKSGNFLFYQTENETSYYTTASAEREVQMTKEGTSLLLYYINSDTSTPLTDDEIQAWIDKDPTNNKVNSKIDAMKTETYTAYTYYTPCRYSEISQWENAANLYYFDTKGVSAAGGDWKPVVKEDGTLDTTYGPKVAVYDGDYGRITGAKVFYIGNQYVESVTGGYEIKGLIEDASHGIFQSKGNIVNLVVGENLSGIGDYAFYGCTALKSITLGNGLDSIGNHAFDNCHNMTTITIPDACKISTIGAYAFNDCQALTSFTLPISVTGIGDGAFKGCWNLSDVNLASSGNGSLTYLGSFVFQDCSSLKTLTFPKGYSETIELSMFEGCTSLTSIRAENGALNIVDSSTCDFTWEAFLLQVTEKFYIEGTSTGTIHSTCTNNEVSFKYMDEDVYELTKKEEGDGNPTVTYQVDSTNTLLQAKFNGTATSLNFPNYIGPYYIQDIGAEAFIDHCSLKEISISETVQSIGARAFQGCHNLAYVYFNTDTVTIGENAFLTQNVTNHEASCTNSGDMTKADNTPAVALHFVGTVGTTSTAYNYAMSYDGRYSAGNQALSFIEYCSGWPTCITVRYHWNTTTSTGYSELVDFPTLSDLDSYASKEYLSSDETDAAADAIENMNNDNVQLTEDQETFINAAYSLTIPAGVDAIQDGLVYKKINDSGDWSKFIIYAQGLKAVEASYKDNETDADGFPVVDYEKSDFAGSANLSEIYFYNDTTTIAEGAFDGDTGLTSVSVNGGTTTIGNHAFKNCSSLSSVTLSSSVQSLGIRPFAGCKELTNVNFPNSTYYTCENSIIYQLTDGVKTQLVECLEGRTSRVDSSNDALSTVTSMAEEAFQGTKLTKIDLSSSAIKVIPSRAFADTVSIMTVELPSAATASTLTIQNDAFKGSYVREIAGEQNVQLISARGLDGIVTSSTNTDQTTSSTVTTYNEKVTIYAPEDSYLYSYAKEYDYTVETVQPTYYWDVTFKDWDEETSTNVIVKTQTVADGEAATAPTPAGRTGYTFTKWDTDFSEVHSDLTVTALYDVQSDTYGKHLVTYYNYDDTVYASEYVADGADAVMNFKTPTRDGYTFTGWRGTLTNITSDVSAYAEYEEGYLLRYYYYDDDGEKVLSYSTYVASGADGPNISAPVTKAGYSFSGWSPAVTNITEPTDTYAQYVADGTTGMYTVTYYSYSGEKLYTYDVASGGTAPNVSAPSRDGYTFAGWMPSLTDVTANRDVVATYTASSSNSSSDSSTSNKTYYTLTVVNGSGSGSYIEGAQPIIVASDPASGLEFSTWSINPTTTTIASTALSATVVTMPASNVTVTANYKTKSSTSTKSNTSVSGNGSSSNANRTSGTTNTIKKNTGTTVVIDKNGLSNTGVVSATVNGSSDNFVIKVTDSATASEAILKALMAEYGSDLSNIKYFPMDITLYDSTGTTKITDTTGLSVSITLPIPDSLITYAGNNKVAGVVNDKLDKLTPRFTTINGVSCITFTAEHFSPYVIYVDTQNLTSATISDSTPKTGDGIHPKWFLSAGLACISFVLFMQKDTGKKKKVKVKAV